MSGLLSSLTNAYTEMLERHRNLPFLKAVMSASAIMALANGKVDDAATALTVDASGASATAASTGANVIGIALTAATADGEVIDVLLMHCGAVPGTAA